MKWGDKVRLRNSEENITNGQPEFLIAFAVGVLPDDVLRLNPLPLEGVPPIGIANYARGAGYEEWSPVLEDGGEVTPTLTGAVNLTGQTAGPAFYVRQGEIVTVHGVLTAQPTLDTDPCSLRIELPVASNLSAAGHLAGTCSEPSGRIEASASPDAALLTFPGFAGSRAISYSFSYRIR